MQISAERSSLSAGQVQQGLLAIARDLDDRVRAWRYPLAADELASEDDLEICERRIFYVFRRPFQVDFARQDVPRILTWLDFHYPSISDRVSELLETLNALVPVAEFATCEDLEETVVALGYCGYRIEIIAHEIPVEVSGKLGDNSSSSGDDYFAEELAHGQMPPNDRVSSANDTESKRTTTKGEAKADHNNRFAELKKWGEAELKGKQLRVLELLIDNDGKLKISALARDNSIEWEVPYENSWNSMRQALNRKLSKAPGNWKISTLNKNAVLSRIG